MSRKLLAIALSLVFLTLFAGCSQTDEKEITMETNGSNIATYKTISPQEGKELMGKLDSFVLLDVRTEKEYLEKHLDGALLIPDSELASRAAAELPNKDETVIVYCRSGQRSAAAAKQLVSMGYTNVLDMGGIMNWPYETVSS